MVRWIKVADEIPDSNVLEVFKDASLRYRIQDKKLFVEKGSEQPASIIIKAHRKGR